MKEEEIFARLLFSIRDKPKEQKEKFLEDFLHFLSKKKKKYLLPRILLLYKRYLGQEKAKLIFSREPDKEELTKVMRLTKKILSSGIAKIEISPELIGGFMISTKDYLIDASIKNQLKRIKAVLWRL